MSRRVPLSLASAVESRTEIAIRRPLPADAAAIRRLADLTGRRVPGGDLLVAEVDGEVVALIGADGTSFGDPFRVTFDVVELLRLRARQLHTVAA
jgi:hypothetical protein